MEKVEKVEKFEILIDNQNVVNLEKLGISLMAVEDKIIVMFDDYKSGYECKECNGKGFKLGCTKCDNMGKDRFDQICSQCQGQPTNVKTTCTVCNGKGGILVIPETAKSLPTTGIVVSMGPDTKAMIYTKNIKENIKLRDSCSGSSKWDVQNEIVQECIEELKAIPIRLGARVIFGPHVGTMIPFKGNIKLKIMRVHEPLAVLFGQDTASRDFIDYEVENY